MLLFGFGTFVGFIVGVFTGMAVAVLTMRDHFMKAIIIQDHDAANLLDSLKLAKLSEQHPFVRNEDQSIHPLSSAEQKILDQLVEAVHRRFHYVVCRWLQEQGASVLR